MDTKNLLSIILIDNYSTRYENNAVIKINKGIVVDDIISKIL